MKNVFRLSGVILLILSIFLIHSCKKEKPTSPIITTTVISAITQTTATSGGNITSDGGANVTARGVCWSTTTGPTTALSTKTIDGTGTGIFASSITALTAGTVYYVKAYATNSAGTAYGNEISFTSTAATVPVLTTTAASAITQTTATSGGNVTSDGGAIVATRGICWNTSGNPTITNEKTTNGTGIGTFTSSMTGLTLSTTYYVRAYATNSVGTAYGNEISFTTLSLTVPTLTTTPAFSKTQTTATSGGDVTSDGGAIVATRGICWNTSGNPTITNEKTTQGTGIGAFTSSMTELSANTSYYVRAYATNSVGTTYGNEISFTTLSLTVPTLTTTPASSITGTTASSGGDVISAGGTTVTTRGVCWSTTQNPTILNILTSNGSGIGAFTSSITELSANTSYYVRAYATNSVGTAYGNEINFTTTASTIPVLTTTAASSITQTTATSGGNVTSDGGAAVTARGVCWSTLSNPTIANNYTSDAAGTGTFTSSITELSANTSYYVRAYATNSAGTGYGNTISFTIPFAIIFNPNLNYGTVNDIDGNVYKTIPIGTQTWMAENLKTSKYNDGTSIPLVTNGAAWAALSTPGYCWYNNDAVTYKATYGALYNWYAVDAASNGGKNVCPTGWHVPTDAEWTILTDYLGGLSGAGGKLKETGTAHWESPNTGATNETGFTALPSGIRQSQSGFSSNISWDGVWWSSNQYYTADGDYRSMNYDYIGVFTTHDPKWMGYSVRCIKD